MKVFVTNVVIAGVEITRFGDYIRGELHTGFLSLHVDKITDFLSSSTWAGRGRKDRDAVMAMKILNIDQESFFRNPGKILEL